MVDDVERGLQEFFIHSLYPLGIGTPVFRLPFFFSG
jgi:hypothetical protein